MFSHQTNQLEPKIQNGHYSFHLVSPRMKWSGTANTENRDRALGTVKQEPNEQIGKSICDLVHRLYT